MGLKIFKKKKKIPTYWPSLVFWKKPETLYFFGLNELNMNEEGLEASYYYREMLASILGVKPRTVMIEAYVDNKSIIEAILSTRLVEDKRLRVYVAAIKESLQLHDVKKIQWVPGHLQLANPMTKQGASGFNLLKVLQSGKMLDELC